MTQGMLLADFDRQCPPVLNGEPNPTAIEIWLKQMEKLYNTMEITNDGDRVALATHQMRGEANFWWDVIKTIQDMATMTWGQFWELFLGKYFLAPVKQAMLQEFLNLRQGSLNVTRYTAKFDELSRHASALVPTNEARARRFEWGLSLTIKGKVMSQQGASYASMVSRALVLEREAQDARQHWEQRKKAEQGSGGPIRSRK